MWTDLYPAKSLISDKIEMAEDAVLLVDVGGSGGHVMEHFAKTPGQRTGRLIVQDLPGALGDADALKQQGIEAMAHDFFTPQPIKGRIAFT